MHARTQTNAHTYAYTRASSYRTCSLIECVLLHMYKCMHARRQMYIRMHAHVPAILLPGDNLYKRTRSSREQVLFL